MPGDLIEASAEPSTILVVDDEPVVRGLLGRWIVGAGYHCAQAGDARAAWDCLQSGGVDLVMSDINMPGESGVELLVRTKQAFPDTPILMLTALGSARAAIDALTAGACGYLIKPVEREELLFQVRQGLERRQLLLDRRRYVESLQRRVQEQTLAVRQAHEETIHRLLTATMYRDEETGAHIRRTGLFSEVLALAAGWARGEAERLRMAAPMHDVGKIGIPDNVLLKPGKLTLDEYEVMKRHTLIGGRLLAGSSSSVLQMAQQIALNHHERWDGTGYPCGVKGIAIPECARIVSVVDVYDALTHDRVYRPAFPQEQALELIHQGMGTQFDPVLLASFFTVIDELERIGQLHPDHPPGEAALAGAAGTAVI